MSWLKSRVSGFLKSGRSGLSSSGYGGRLEQEQGKSGHTIDHFD